MNVPNQDISGEFSIPVMKGYINYCKSYVSKYKNNNTYDKNIISITILIYKCNIYIFFLLYFILFYFILFYSKCAPHLSEEAAAKLRDNFVALRSEVKKLEEQTSQRTSIPITVR